MLEFQERLDEYGFGLLRRRKVETLQINVGKVCNQACLHCHVEAGPKRTENMTEAVADRVLQLLERSAEIRTVDITGGAPELNPQFRRLVEAGRARGHRVIDRCNLTILLEPGHETLAEFLARNYVHVIASLPCYTPGNVDKQRGRGVFEKSIRTLRMLNELGYGQAASGLELDLVYNPLGPSLPPPQERLEVEYKEQLRGQFGIEFNRLLTITNMPIRRFADSLLREGGADRYVQLLADNFNAATVESLMCRSLVSVSFDGRLYDCDFNQMAEMPAASGRSVWEIESFDELADRMVTTARHCYGCTAGAGSSCGGQLSGT